MPQISGKLVKVVHHNLPEEDKATIELPPVNPQDIKEGDEVWVKASMHNSNGQLYPILDVASGYVVHFPRAKTAELPEEIDLDYWEKRWKDVLYHTTLLRKINQLIRYLKEKELKCLTKT